MLYSNMFSSSRLQTSVRPYCDLARSQYGYLYDQSLMRWYTDGTFAQDFLISVLLKVAHAMTSTPSICFFTSWTSWSRISSWLSKGIFPGHCALALANAWCICTYRSGHSQEVERKLSSLSIASTVDSNGNAVETVGKCNLIKDHVLMRTWFYSICLEKYTSSKTGYLCY